MLTERRRMWKCASSLTCRATPFHRHCVSDGDFLLVSLQAMTLHLAPCNEQTKHSGPCYTGLHHSAANKACCSGVLIFPRPWYRVAESRARMEVVSGVIGLSSLPALPFPGGSWGQRMLFSRGFPHAGKMCDLWSGLQSTKVRVMHWRLTQDTCLRPWWSLVWNGTINHFIFNVCHPEVL